MSIFLSCCFLGVFLILIWCSLQHPEESRPSSARQESPKDQLEYVPISPAVLGEWAVRDEHLMIIDLRTNANAERDLDIIPGSLQILLSQLKSYFCYLPPNTRLLIPMKMVSDSDWIPVTGSEVKLIVFGAKRRWRSYPA